MQKVQFSSNRQTNALAHASGRALFVARIFHASSRIVKVIEDIKSQLVFQAKILDTK